MKWLRGPRFLRSVFHGKIVDILLGTARPPHLAEDRRPEPRRPVCRAEPNLARLFAAEERGADRDFSVILFWANGGPSHLDTFDLKPDAPAEIRGPFRPIRTNVPGLTSPSCCRRLAKMADKFALVRSLHHNRGEHSGGTHRFLTGYPSVAANLQRLGVPGHRLGRRQATWKARPGDVPLYVGNTKFYGGGPAYLGPAYAPFMPSPNNPLSSTGNNTYDPVPLYLTDESRRRRCSWRPTRRCACSSGADLLRSARCLAAAPSTGRSAGRLRPASAPGRGDAGRPPDARGVRPVARKPQTRRAALRRHALGQEPADVPPAGRGGRPLRAVPGEYRLPARSGRTSNWDDHSVNSRHLQGLRGEAAGARPGGVGADRGPVRSAAWTGTCCSSSAASSAARRDRQSGRQPAGPGRDHWPRAMSVFLAGGGLKMGQVIGATNARGEEPVQRAMDSNCLLATIYHRFGIDVAPT